jgi:hypothetical protein
MTTKYYTTVNVLPKFIEDGFGAQYLKIIHCYVFAKMYDLNFVYSPFVKIEHNYNNDPEYENKMENIVNLKNHIQNVEKGMNIEYLDFPKICMPHFEKNIHEWAKSEHMNFIKKCYWENKERDVFKNSKFNIAVHIRRVNKCDEGKNPDNRVKTPNNYFLSIMNLIRKKYSTENILFHIYSQGDINNFKEFISDDVEFHINSDVITSFLEMASADVLVTSPSCFSYVPALLSHGEVYYNSFWHGKLEHWIECYE